MPPIIRVLVVDDSALIRQMLTRALSLDPRIEVVGTARTGAEAIEQAVELEPDVVTLDIEMPELSGLEALPFITRRTNARVIMLSSLDSPDVTYQALSSGAVDFITKPRGGVASSLTDLSELLLKKIRTAQRIDPAKRVFATSGEMTPAPQTECAQTLDRLVVIAASTGGPPALERVFHGLTAELPAAYLIVQHLPAGFTGSFARRLDSVTDIRVTEAEQSAMVRPGHAYVAPHGRHMSVVPSGAALPEVHLEEGPSIHGVRPAADPLFESAAALMGDRVVGVVLTGMGADGAEGLARVRERGGETIAQNEETSVVWGMPGAAARKGAARRIVPIDLVAAEVRKTMRVRGAVS